MSFGFGRLNDLVDRCHDYAKRAGFWQDLDELDPICVLAKMALIHSEVSEGVEAIRKPHYGNLEEELADIVIRVFDLAGALDFNLEQAIVDKMTENEDRPYMHGKRA